MFTLADAVVFLQDRDAEDGGTRAARVYKKIANESNRRLRMLGKFEFDKRYGDLAFAGVYNTGTVAISAGGTTVTGTGTTFTTAMTGRYIRFRGETLQYKFTYVGATSGTISPAYYGTSNLSGVTFELTDDRQALPSGFRDFAWPLTDVQAVPRLRKVTLEEIKMYRRVWQLTTYPWLYAVEIEDVSSLPTPYLHIYPSLSEKRVITLPYYKWPTELTDDAHVFGLPVEAESNLQMFMRALLRLEQNKPDWRDMLAEAEKEGLKALASFRAVSEDNQRAIWTPEGDQPRLATEAFGGFAPGEPLYTGT